MRPSAADIVMDRDLGQCIICGHRGTDGHHRDPVGMGGSSDPDRDAIARIMLTCRGHHAAIHAHPAEAESLGYYLITGDAYDRVPVWSVFHRCWWLLLESGVRVPYPNFSAPSYVPRWAL